MLLSRRFFTDSFPHHLCHIQGFLGHTRTVPHSCHTCTVPLHRLVTQSHTQDSARCKDHGTHQFVFHIKPSTILACQLRQLLAYRAERHHHQHLDDRIHRAERMYACTAPQRHRRATSETKLFFPTGDLGPPHAAALFPGEIASHESPAK